MPALRTEAQKLASRLNGQKSQGPKTAEGKAISARNAIKHGLNSASVVLWCERKDKYLEYLQDLTAEWQPETITELELVTAIADAQWQLKRLAIVRTASMDLEMDRAEKSFREDFPASDEATRLALAWQALAVGSRTLSELNRHEAHLRRTVDRSISKLLAIHAQRARSRDAGQDRSTSEAVAGQAPFCASSSEAARSRQQQEDQPRDEQQPQHENTKNEPETAATVIPITSRPAADPATDNLRQHPQHPAQIYGNEPEPLASTTNSSNPATASNCGKEPGAVIRHETHP